MVGDASYLNQQDVKKPAVMYNFNTDKEQAKRNSDFDAYMKKASAAKAVSKSKVQNFTQFDISKFGSILSAITRTTSTQKCAKSIRVALQNAGAQIDSHPIAASDWGGTLKKLGFNKILPQFDKPQKGDIYIIKATPKHTYGHIAGYTGSNWVSDFKQRTYDVYRDQQVIYEYYRLAK